MRLLLCIVALAICAVRPALASSSSLSAKEAAEIAKQRANTDETTAFACPQKRVELSRHELERLAIAEFEKRGGRISRDGFESKIASQGCDWMVGIKLLPAAPGRHFGVVIDGTSGKVKDYLGGS